MGEVTQIGKSPGLLHVCGAAGQKVLYSNTIDADSPDQKENDCVSGSTVGTSIVPDLTFGATYPLSVESDRSCPYGTQLNGIALSRYKVKDWFVSMLGVTAWATLKAIELQDNAGYPLIHIPLVAISGPAFGPVTYKGPVSDSPLGIVATAASATATTVTFPASSFVNTKLAGSPFMIVAGTGAGQTGTAKTCTATVLTPDVPLATKPDSTSVFVFFYCNVTSASGTTAVIQSNVDMGDLSNGWWAVVIAGTGAGQARQITASSFDTVSETLTVATWTTTLDSTSTIAITKNPSQMGIIDFTGYQWAASTPGKGVQWNVYGTASGAGSPLRYGVHGYWSDFG